MCLTCYESYKHYHFYPSTRCICELRFYGQIRNVANTFCCCMLLSLLGREGGTEKNGQECVGPETFQYCRQQTALTCGHNWRLSRKRMHCCQNSNEDASPTKFPKPQEHEKILGGWYPLPLHLCTSLLIDRTGMAAPSRVGNIVSTASNNLPFSLDWLGPSISVS